jgi:biotin carboxyl carrier protein
VRYIVTVGGRTLEVEVGGDGVTVDGRRHTATLGNVAGTAIAQLLVDGRPVELAIAGQGQGRWDLTHAGERWEVDVIDERTRHIRSLTGAGERGRGAGALRAPMPGLVVRVQAEPGQAVAAGAGVVVLEAMKMENELRAAAGAVVKAVHARAGDTVEKGQILVEFE